MYVTSFLTGQYLGHVTCGSQLEADYDLHIVDGEESGLKTQAQHIRVLQTR